MTPLNELQTSLLLAVQTAERRVAQYHAAAKPELDDRALEHLRSDHRAAVAGDIADALDTASAGLGERFMAALFPELDMELTPESIEHLKRLFRLLGDEAAVADIHAITRTH